MFEPSFDLRNELSKLQRRGVAVRTGVNAVNRLHAQLNRCLVWMKNTQNSGSAREITNLDFSLGRMERAFTALARNKNREITFDLASGLHVSNNQIDFEEIVGNLLDIALKWSQSKIKLRAISSDGLVRIIVEDDGSGFAEGAVDRALINSLRLDESKSGTGLGLAIATDLIAASRGELGLDRSKALGGARVIVVLHKADLALVGRYQVHPQSDCKGPALETTIAFP